MKQLIFLFLALACLNAHAFDTKHECQDSYEKVSASDSAGYITLAYFEYCSISSPPNLELVQIILNDSFLRMNHGVGDGVIQSLEQKAPDMIGFIKAVKASANWAKNEKTKSANTLYLASQNPPQKVKKYHWEDNFKSAYLLLAVKKGHLLAIKELEEVDKKTLQKKKELIQKNQDNAN